MNRNKDGNITKIETVSSQQEETITKIHVESFPSPHASHFGVNLQLMLSSSCKSFASNIV